MSASTSASCWRSETNPARDSVGSAAEHDVLAHRQRRDDAVGLAVLRDERDAGRDGGSRRSRLDRVARRPRPRRCRAAARRRWPWRSRSGRIRAGRRVRRPRRRAPRPSTSSRTWRRVRSRALAAATRVVLRRVVCVPKRVLARATSDSSRPSIMETSSSRVISRDRSGVDAAPVAKHGHHVAQPEDLVEPVRDVDDRHAVAPQEIDDLQQALDLARLERRGGLVHDDDPVIGVDRARDGDHLLDAEAELPERPPDVDVDAVAGEARAGFAMHPAEVDEPEAVGRLAAEEQVPRDAHQRDQVDLLVDRADARPPARRSGRAKVTGSPR